MSRKKTVLSNNNAILNIEMFSKNLQNQAYSNNTIKGYCNDIKLYAWWAEMNDNVDKTLDQLTRDSIIEYKNYLKINERADAKTINHKLSSLKSYNEYLLECGKMNTFAIIKKDMCKIQTEFANPTTITQDDVDEFLNAIKNDTRYTSQRDYVIANMLAYMGLRISECLSIQFDDINWKDKELTITGKGNKQRIVFISDRVFKLINDYIKNNRTEKNYNEHIKSSYLFISSRSDKLTVSRINQIFDDYNTKIHPHSLRHYFCTHALESNMNIHEIANQAGHSNIQTTMRYTNPTKEAMRSKMNLL